MPEQLSSDAESTELPDTGIKVKSLHAAGLEAYRVEEVHRSQLKNAPYNPRVLTDSQRRRLAAGLKKHGE